MNELTPEEQAGKIYMFVHSGETFLASGFVTPPNQLPPWSLWERLLIWLADKLSDWSERLYARLNRRYR